MREHQVPAPTYQEILDRDGEEIPAVLRATAPLAGGCALVPIERYVSRAFHELEKERLWGRVWQWACREEHIPNPGDTYVYDIADRSYLIVRGEDGVIRGFVNACLHRGRRLRERSERCSALRCSFHGFTWGLEGELRFIPSEWDFAEFANDRAAHALPQVRVGVWEGFVFINPDPHAEDLEEFLGDLGEHFSRWRMRERRVEAHVQKVVRANWKIAQEAFCEAFHAGATHPQTVVRLGDVNSQVDVWRSFSRVITPSLVQSPTLRRVVGEEEMIRATLDVRLDQECPIPVPAGRSAREIGAEMARERWRGVMGGRVDELCTAEFVDSIDYTVFPNFHPWGGVNRIVYRFRPNGDDHRSSVMEVLFLSPTAEGGERTPARVTALTAEDSWTRAPELGMLAKVFDQDEHNMHEVQRGLETTRETHIVLGAYQEAKIRWLHQMLEERMGLVTRVEVRS